MNNRRKRRYGPDSKRNQSHENLFELQNREDQIYDNFSDTGPVDIAKELGWDMHQTGGLLANLENKGMACR